MFISSRFAVGIHILSVLEINKDGVNSSEFLARSVKTNPAVIRKFMGMLKKAGLVKVRPGIAGAELARIPSDITLLDVFKAVNSEQKELFSVHSNTSQTCPVGRNIQDTIMPLFSIAQLAFEKALGHVTIDDVVKDIVNKERLNN